MMARTPLASVSGRASGTLAPSLTGAPGSTAKTLKFSSPPWSWTKRMNFESRLQKWPGMGRLVSALMGFALSKGSSRRLTQMLRVPSSGFKNEIQLPSGESCAPEISGSPNSSSRSMIGGSAGLTVAAWGPLSGWGAGAAQAIASAARSAERSRTDLVMCAASWCEDAGSLSPRSFESEAGHRLVIPVEPDAGGDARLRLAVGDEERAREDRRGPVDVLEEMARRRDGEQVRAHLGIEVGGHLEARRVGQRRCPQEAGHAADPGQVGHHVIGRPRRDRRRHRSGAEEVLADLDGRRDLARDPRRASVVIVSHRLLDPVDPFTLERPPLCQRLRHGERLVEVRHQKRVARNLRADGAGGPQVFRCRFASQAELDGVEAFGQQRNRLV